MAYGSVNVGASKIDESKFLTTDQVGTPGNLATLDANGKLSEAQRPTVDAYTKAQTDEKVSSAVTTHNSDETAHGDIRASLSELDAAIKALDLKYGTNVTKNPFSVTFTSLDGVEVEGVWNAEQGRIEF